MLFILVYPQYHCKDSLNSGDNVLVYNVLTFECSVSYFDLNTEIESESVCFVVFC
jgi:hypothetical protein